jgi:hypothetical protein
MVNYEVAVKKPFTDLMKLVIGIVLSIIPIVNTTVVTGFAIDNSGLGRTKPSKKMPEWKDWWYLFVKGVGAIIINIVYLIPAIVVLVIAAGLAVSDIAGTIIGSQIASQISSGQATPEVVGQIFRQNWYLLMPIILQLAPLIILGALLALLAMFLTPMAILNYVKNKRLGAAFDLRTVTRKAFTSKYIVAWVLVSILYQVLGAILGFIPWLGPAIVLFVVGVIGYSLYGQVYKEV